MKTRDVEIILQRARERSPDARPRIISDNGPQFIAKDFKVFIRLGGMTHVRTSPYYPQSNGKIERWHKSLKAECVRPATPLCVDDARRAVARFVDTYNTQRLHSAIGYIAPADKLAGQADQIHAARDRKLAAARETRRKRRQTLGLESPRVPSPRRRLTRSWAASRRRDAGGRPHGSSRPEAECLNDNRRRNDTERCL